MKQLIVLLLVLANAAFAQQAPPRLIVRGDDIGSSHAVNEAILKCYTEGIQTSVEIMVPTPWFPEAVKLLNEHTNVDVGVHLTLTSEWDNVKWRPVSNAPSLCDVDGYFRSMVFPNKNYQGNSLSENPWKLEEIEKEFRAQIELARKKVPRISHLSYHMGCNSLSPKVKALVDTLAAEYHLDIDLDKLGVTAVGYRGASRTSSEKIESFIKMLESLEPGKTYWFIDHPGLDTPEMRAIHHIGYEGVAMDRQGVTDTFTSPRVKEVIKAKGIELIGYNGVKQ